MFLAQAGLTIDLIRADINEAPDGSHLHRVRTLLLLLVSSAACAWQPALPDAISKRTMRAASSSTWVPYVLFMVKAKELPNELSTWV